jgi:dTMP kinase
VKKVEVVVNSKPLERAGIKGKFISFEGGEGGGKTTQITLLTQALTAAGINVLQTREPGGSSGGEEIRRLLVDGALDRWDAVTETLLHSAARRDHLAQIILPALDKGQWVLTDRFADSTMAYQGYGHGISKKAIHNLYQFVAGNRKPDMTIILDLPIKEGLSRSDSRSNSNEYKDKQIGDRYERMGSAFHERLRSGFLEIAKINRKRCVVIDTTRSIGEIATDIRRLVFKKFAVNNNE